MTAFLPQHDPLRLRRKLDLQARRAIYQYNYTYVSPLAMVEDVPFTDEFSVTWLVQVADRILKILANRIELDGDRTRRELHQKMRDVFLRLVRATTLDASGLIRTIRETLEKESAARRPQSLEDYASLFRTIGLPAISRDYQQDGVFAEMRLAGPNPVMLQRVTQLDDRFPVTQAHYTTALPGDTLHAAGQEGRLYLADYQLLEQVDNGTFPNGPKFVYAPLALFAVDKVTRQLLPVAIQCKQTPAADNPIFTRADGYQWLIAKTIVEIADGNVHEAVTHLGRTHLFVEPFVVSTQRQLATNHPLGILLRPHFEGTLAINNAAHEYLIAPRGPVDKLLAGTIESTRALAVSAVQSYLVDNVMLPDTFRRRGVDDHDLLPNYPYRDDAMLYWSAIHQWVRNYLRLYYTSNADVQQDTELRSWFQELTSQQGGRLRGFGQPGSFGDLNYLTEVVTLIIYTSSVQHAAVNFPQYDLMTYVPNMPLAGYTAAPTAGNGGTEQNFLDMLPPMDMAQLQVELGYLLGSVHYTTLGQYDRGHFRDGRVGPVLDTLQQQLRDIGPVIDQRNQARRPYNFLVPSGVPQSINI
jgi:arachidonate 15-lipoxygenase